MTAHPRHHLHLKAYELMQKEQFSSALIELRKTVTEFGPHVSLLADLASCYYMVGDYLNYRETTKLLLNEYNSAKELLSPQTMSEVTLGLGKLLEEMGQLVPAIELFQNYPSLQTDHFEAWQKRIRSQLLRLLCFLRQGSQIADLYVACEQMQDRDGHNELEIQHAIMLADFELFGFDAAFHRLQTVRSKLPVFMERLYVFDLLFECLRRGQGQLFKSEYFQKLLYLECDPYEQALWDLWSELQNESPVSALSLIRSDGMSPMGACRYFYLLQMLSQNAALAQSARQKFHLILRTFDTESRNAILKFWPIASSTQVLRLGSEQMVIEDGKTVSLKKQKNLINLLSLFQTQDCCTVEVAIAQLFETEYDELSFNRLRNAVSRANDFLAIELGLQNPLQLNKNMLKLASHLKIESAS
jgi:hypothetical protein